MSLARYLSKLGVLLNSGGQVSTAGHEDGSITTAKLANSNVTQAKLETLVTPLGVGQTWQDVTASRASGTTYTNTTGRPIFVVVSQSSSTTNYSIQVNGVNINSFTSAGYSTACSAVVPSGATYKLTGGSLASPIGWAELR